MSNNDKKDENTEEPPPYYAGYYKNPDIVIHDCLEKQPPVHERGYDATKCDPYIEEIAKPKKRYYLDILETYYHVLSATRITSIKRRVEEEFGWTPEQTEDYFNELRENNLLKRKNNESQLKEIVEMERRKNSLILNECYRALRKWIRLALQFSQEYLVPPLFGNRVRIISDIILRQLTRLYDPPLKIPNRSKPKGKFNCLLICVADWLAFMVEYLHYEVVSDNIEMRRKVFMEKRSLLYPGGSVAGEGEDELVGGEAPTKPLAPTHGGDAAAAASDNEEGWETEQSTEDEEPNVGEWEDLSTYEEVGDQSELEDGFKEPQNLEAIEEDLAEDLEGD